MKNTFSRPAALLLAVALSYLPAHAGSPAEDISVAYVAWDAAFNAGDAPAVGAFYTEEAVFLPPTHDVIEGPAGVEKFFDGLFGMGVTGHKLDLIEAHADGDLIVAAARWSATGKSAAGAAEPWGGVATHVFQRQPDGGLKLMLHTFN